MALISASAGAGIRETKEYTVWTEILLTETAVVSERADSLFKDSEELIARQTALSRRVQKVTNDVNNFLIGLIIKYCGCSVCFIDLPDRLDCLFRSL